MMADARGATLSIPSILGAQHLDVSVDERRVHPALPQLRRKVVE